jgi:hypothetical protein
MSKQYLSIKDAIHKTGMSDASLRRLCRKGVKGRDYKHDLEGRLILLDSFLYTHYPPIIKAHQMSMKADYDAYKLLQTDIEFIKDIMNQQPVTMLGEKDKRIEDLKKEIDTKNYTINHLASTINSLNNNIGLLTERNREQNIIIQSLQEKIPHQLKASQPIYVQPKQNQKSGLILIDKILIGVAILASVAILSFLGMIIWAYLNK